jgi:hypothetical protein
MPPPSLKPVLTTPGTAAPAPPAPAYRASRRGVTAAAHLSNFAGERSACARSRSRFMHWWRRRAASSVLGYIKFVCFPCSASAAQPPLLPQIGIEIGTTSESVQQYLGISCPHSSTYCCRYVASDIFARHCCCSCSCIASICHCSPLPVLVIHDIKLVLEMIYLDGKQLWLQFVLSPYRRRSTIQSSPSRRGSRVELLCSSSVTQQPLLGSCDFQCDARPLSTEIDCICDYW